MKNLIIILTIFLSMSVSYQLAYSQWIQRYNGPDNLYDNAHSIAVDGSGNVYVTGSSFGIGTHSDYATIKYNSSGVQQWVQRYNGTENGDDAAQSIAVDGLGNIYVTGSSNFTFPPFGHTYDYATIKYNSSGVQQWAQIYNSPGNGYDVANSIAVDGSENVYVTGESGGIGTGNDYVTIKYNSSGDSLWVRRYNGSGNSNDHPFSLAVDRSGNVYVTGQSGIGGVGNGYDYATIKYDSSGVQQWVQGYNGPPGNDEDIGFSIAIDSSGNVYVTGYSWGNGNYGYATIKYNSNGDSIWVQRYVTNGGAAHSIAVDGSGNVYVTGGSYKIGGFDLDYATIKYNSNGDSLWVQRYSGPGNNHDVAGSIAVDGSGNVYVTGRTFVSGTYDYATIKYNSSGVRQWVQRYDGPPNRDDMVSSMAMDSSGNVYVTGMSNGFGTETDYATIKYSQQPITTLNLTALIEGFYDNVTNKMVEDTIRVYLRNTSSPYSIVDSAKSVLDSTGHRIFYFPNAVNGTLYYIVIKHRNSIETWSSQGRMFTDYQLSYYFITGAYNAYGNNLKLKGSKYCIYSGDINQDGYVDVLDLGLVYNDLQNSVSGYVNTDLTGDNSVNVIDLGIVHNNSNNSVSLIRP